ncbi:MAG: glycoside hydrolase family 15 protein [Actinomycetaceae bacterium]|nr:glycoside hydrolase family 15 protein [Actinomycetaceae bacterium]MDY5272615.1 glycoside hydrolase family 15 protein [Arcanobacterium sp.]
MRPAAISQDVVTTSIELIKKWQEPNGAYAASPDFVAYTGYCWLRDGAFIADAMSVAGEKESASAFFNWCTSTLLRHEDLISEVINASQGGELPDIHHMPPTRFTFEGEIQDDGWENFQLDGYGTWVWAALAHTRRHGLCISRWQPAIALSIRYICACWDRPCYDWWEEHSEHQHVSTLGCLVAGLREAIDSKVLDPDLEQKARIAKDAMLERIASEGVVHNHLTKWIGGVDIDASLAALISPLGIVDPLSVVASHTIENIDVQLCVAGGVHRFLADKYYGGGQWPLLSCFLGLGYLAIGRKERAHELLMWACGTANENGDIPEQVDWHMLDALHAPYWRKRWGAAASPLLWSHAMVIRLYHALLMEDAI